MLRGEIRLVNFDPSLLGEASKTRPAVLVSNDAANQMAARLGRGVLTVVPITSNLKNVYPFQVEIASDRSGLPVDSKAQAEQVRSVAVDRIGDRIGSLPVDLMLKVDTALRLHLSL